MPQGCRWGQQQSQPLTGCDAVGCNVILWTSLWCGYPSCTILKIGGSKVLRNVGNFTSWYGVVHSISSHITVCMPTVYTLRNAVFPSCWYIYQFFRHNARTWNMDWVSSHLMQPSITSAVYFWNVSAAVTQILPYLRTRIKYFEEYRFSVDQDLMLVAVFCTNEDEYN